MFIDAIDSEEYEWDNLHISNVAGNLGGRKACILEKEQLSCSIQFETKIRDSFSLQARQNEIKPMMSSCTSDFKYNSDGSWEITTWVDFTNNESKDESSECCDENSSSQETAETDSQDQG